MVDVARQGRHRAHRHGRGPRRSWQPATLDLIAARGCKKGDVLAVAQLAGIMARQAHRRPDPAVPSAAADAVTVELDARAARNAASGSARPAASTGRTGVEMEALTAAAVAALTVYDMCKAVDRGMRITDIRLAPQGRRPLRRVSGRGA